MALGIAIAPLVALIAGIAILFMPRLLNAHYTGGVAVWRAPRGLAEIAALNRANCDFRFDLFEPRS